jgi:hypothetical protein
MRQLRPIAGWCVKYFSTQMIIATAIHWLAVIHHTLGVHVPKGTNRWEVMFNAKDMTECKGTGLHAAIYQACKATLDICDAHK